MTLRHVRLCVESTAQWMRHNLRYGLVSKLIVLYSLPVHRLGAVVVVDRKIERGMKGKFSAPPDYIIVFAVAHTKTLVFTVNAVDNDNCYCCYTIAI